MMKYSWLILPIVGVLMAQGPTVSPARTAEPGSAQGRFYRLRLVKIIDEQGFGRPVEVVRLLLPPEWRVESNVRWDNQQIRCPMNIIKIQFRATAPDGLTGIEFAPGYMWQSATDPTIMQILRQQAAARTGCDVGPVTGSIAYLRQSAVPLRPGARVVGAEPLTSVTQAKQALLAQSYEPMVRAGYVRGYHADSGSVRIAYSHNGQPLEEWLSTTILTVASPSANTAALMQGQVNMNATTYSVISEGVFSARAPEGKLDKKLIATIVASTRPNPQYQAAVSQFLANMTNIAQRGAMDRARIWQEAGRQISGTITQTYQHQQAVQDRAAQQFSQTIRGIETYVNPSTGTRVELTGGYDNAWVNARGEYLLSDSPGFNPGVALHENWTQLNKAR